MKWWEWEDTLEQLVYAARQAHRCVDSAEELMRLGSPPFDIEPQRVLLHQLRTTIYRLLETPVDDDQDE